MPGHVGTADARGLEALRTNRPDNPYMWRRRDLARGRNQIKNGAKSVPTFQKKEAHLFEIL